MYRLATQRGKQNENNVGWCGVVTD